ncbi:pumilio domain-containing protein kiaa0020 [Cystoisospora suis]|uniref:Pumilio domain-containing protein kiaa0020 n=1 Tax=Cystoisospora suis TaxID=483139 RepID=A0A2C6L0A1_9APIC|nr:pumilio domain-containing protein kiaa0020 [Cystoisospora suis]
MAAALNRRQSGGRGKAKTGSKRTGKKFSAMSGGTKSSSVKKKGTRVSKKSRGKFKDRQKSRGSAEEGKKRKIKDTITPASNTASSRSSNGDDLVPWTDGEGKKKGVRSDRRETNKVIRSRMHSPPEKKKIKRERETDADVSGPQRGGPSVESGKRKIKKEGVNKKKSFEEQLQEYLRNQQMTESTAGMKKRQKTETGGTVAGKRDINEEEGDGVNEQSGRNSQAGDGITSNLSVSKKRKLMGEMVLSRRNEDAGYIKQCFRLYGQLLASRPEQNAGSDEVRERVSALFAFILPRVKERDRHLCTSRALQALFKFGSPEQRRRLWDLLKGDFAELCMGRTSCHVAMKVHLYGDKETQKEITDMLASHKDIFFSKCGARVWEYVYTAMKSAKGQQQMLNAVMLPPLAIVRVPDVWQAPNFSVIFEKMDRETKQATMEHLSSLIQKCVDKELLDKAPVHRILRYFTLHGPEEQVTAAFQMTAEGFLRLASTKDGVEAMVRMLGFATAKQRKHLVKEMKKVVMSMVRNPVDCPLILRVLCTVDDTKLLRDLFVKEIAKDARSLAFDAHGHLVLLQLLDLNGYSRYLPLHYRQILQLPSPTSLKPIDVRLGELRGPVVEALEHEFQLLISSSSGRPSDAESGDTVSENKKNSRQRMRDGATPTAGSAEAPDNKETDSTEGVGESLLEWLRNPMASRVFMEFLKGSKCPVVFRHLVSEIAANEASVLSYLDHPQVQRLLCSLVKQADDSWKFGPDTGPAVKTQRKHEEDSALSGNDDTLFLDALWRQALWPHLSVVLLSRGVFLVTHTFQAARRLSQKNLENEIRTALNSDVLFQARQAVQSKGLSTAGLDMLSAKLEEE